MDHRTPLKPNTQLSLCNDRGEVIHFVIENEISRGGSCIVYEAARLTGTDDKTLYRIKEFYPYKFNITRDGSNNLVPSMQDADVFQQNREQFRTDFSRTNRLFYSGSNYAMLTNQLDIFNANGTSYILSAYSSKNTLATYTPGSLKECIMLVRQTAYVLGNIHQEGYLYLDTKPDNILVIDGFQKQVQLFDFDSMFPIWDIKNIDNSRGMGERLSYSRGFAPVELQTSNMKRLRPHSDVYSVGALLFYLLFGKTPTASDCGMDAEYNFASVHYDCGKCDDRVFRVLTEFFHHTLAAYYADRYQSMSEVTDRLQKLEKYADLAVPRIFSTKISRTSIFHGRDQEFRELDCFFEDKNNNCLFITGMGGIGKSTLIREYMVSRRRNFDTVLYVNYKGSIVNTIIDDNSIGINTLTQDEAAEPDRKYFHRKLRKIRELVRDTASVFVIDNFTGSVDPDFRSILETGLKVIVLTRKAPSGRNSFEMKISAISDIPALRYIFEENLGRPIHDHEQPGFEQILQSIGNHTLALELIAKQIANSHITIAAAVELTAVHGFSSIAPEKVEYEKDYITSGDTIGNIIDGLFQSDALSEEKRCLLKTVSLTGDNGIDMNQLQEILGLPSKDGLNELIKDGWLTISGDVVSMHRVIAEAVHRWEWTTIFTETAEKFLTWFYVKIRVESTRNDLPKKYYDCMMGVIDIENSRKARSNHKDDKMADQYFRSIKENDLAGKVYAERCSHIMENSPADTKKLAALLIQSEDILEQCKREPAIRSMDIFTELLCVSLLNMPQYREEYILAAADEIFSDSSCMSKLKNKIDSPDESNCMSPVTVMHLYNITALIHADNKRFEEAEKLIAHTKRFAEKINHSRVYALYYELLSAYYDSLLDGAYEPKNKRETILLDKMFNVTEKTLYYSKGYISSDINHLYINNILAKATLYMRSGRGSKRKVDKLINTANKLITENTLPYAKVRLHYYLVCAWYFTYVCGNAELADEFIRDALNLSGIISSNDLQRIEDVIIPCANIYFELGYHAASVSLLYKGTRVCEKYRESDAYVRIKQELCDHIWEVGIDGKLFDSCREILEIIENENTLIKNPKCKVIISEMVRSAIINMSKV
ncbi:MAG: NB-ARC domain-containing protein [Clostridiales bacterium]|nr:NB-ARC domain-containing protein [Clostridiales bacterium]